jgi:hypothetical protein
MTAASTGATPTSDTGAGNTRAGDTPAARREGPWEGPEEPWEGPRDGRRDRVGAWARQLPRRAGRLAGRHWGLMLLVLAGAVLRLLVMIAYNPAFWYQGDSQGYLTMAYIRQPDVLRPYGYSAFLSLLIELRSVRQIIAVQHAMGLAIAAGAYVYLQRRGVSRLVSALAATPLLLDARTVSLEHFLLAETLFTGLIVLGMMALTWRDTPGWLGVLVATGAFSWAAVTRSIGLVALAVPLFYLLLRRVDWRKTLAFVAVVGAVLGGYVTWYHGVHGQYSFGTWGQRLVWARTLSFVDCDRLELTAQQRRLCPAQPRGERLEPSQYLWGPDSLPPDLKEPRHDATFGSFARKAILAQPADYAAVIGRETLLTLRPGPYPDAVTTCIAAVWDLPAPGQRGCQSYLAPYDPDRRRLAALSGERNHPLMRPLHAYARLATVPATLVGLCVLLVLGLAWHLPRASRRRDRLDPLAWATLAIGMIIGSVATSMMDPRYTTPSLPLAVIGAALAWQRFRTARRAPPTPHTDRPTPDAPPTDRQAPPAPHTEQPAPDGPPTDRQAPPAPHTDRPAPDGRPA